MKNKKAIFSSDGGYVLIYVIFTVLLVSVICAAVLSSSYRSLKRETDAFLYMKSKYEAEGQIEAALAVGERFTDEVHLVDGMDSDGFSISTYEGAYVTVSLDDSDGVGGDSYMIYAYPSDRSLRIEAVVVFDFGTGAYTFKSYKIETENFDVR
ncbi:MAG: hypothetical protein LUD43_02120 [Firmicutes bacterium]|nr:hypothetical protein [Bacillota bacterium]